MYTYYLVILGLIAVICCIVWLIKRFIVKSNAETDISALLITSGITLLLSAFAGIQENVMMFIGNLVGKEISFDTDYSAIICGFILIIVGIFYRHNIKDRIYILNIFGISVQNEIADEQNIKDLKLIDFKVKEMVIDFVDIFNINMTTKLNTLIVNKIKKMCVAFVNRSQGFKACYTGMAPIPYTILAGTYLCSGKICRYFEYKRTDSKYYELKKKRKSKYEKLITTYPQNESNCEEVVFCVSVTRKIQQSDLVQFSGKDIIEIGLPHPDDNIIVSIPQLDEYANEVIRQMERLKIKYPSLKTVHLIASIPSCLSVEIGKLAALNVNRLPKVVSYHFANTSTPKYPFGIVISDSEFDNIGKLVKG